MIKSTVLFRLVRGPAALTVLGDTLVGAAAAGRPLRGPRLALPLASVALYWAWMALNDYADRAGIRRPVMPDVPGPAASLTGRG